MIKHMCFHSNKKIHYFLDNYLNTMMNKGLGNLKVMPLIDRMGSSNGPITVSVYEA